MEVAKKRPARKGTKGPVTTPGPVLDMANPVVKELLLRGVSPAFVAQLDLSKK